MTISLTCVCIPLIMPVPKTYDFNNNVIPEVVTFTVSPQEVYDFYLYVDMKTHYNSCNSKLETRVVS